MELEGLNCSEVWDSRLEEALYGKLTNTKGFSEIHIKIYLCKSFLKHTYIQKVFKFSYTVRSGNANSQLDILCYQMQTPVPAMGSFFFKLRAFVLLISQHCKLLTILSAFDLNIRPYWWKYNTPESQNLSKSSLYLSGNIICTESYHNVGRFCECYRKGKETNPLWFHRCYIITRMTMYDLW